MKFFPEGSFLAFYDASTLLRECHSNVSVCVCVSAKMFFDFDETEICELAMPCNDQDVIYKFRKSTLIKLKLNETFNDNNYTARDT